jgi:hypothetical protein
MVMIMEVIGHGILIMLAMKHTGQQKARAYNL